MQLTFDLNSVEDYQRFLRCKQIPLTRFHGMTATFPDEYAHMLGINGFKRKAVTYKPHPSQFDYGRDITRIAIAKKKYAIFADCGLGKTFMLLDYAKHVLKCLPKKKRFLITSPIMVLDQTIEEAKRWFGDELPIERVRARDLAAWTAGEIGEERLGITNYEALGEHVQRGCVGALGVDESSMMKSQYGKWGQDIIRIGEGLEWKLCLTGTPAPNDRIEYGNHAVFLDIFPTLNSFLAKYFVNRGNTQNRWEMKPHAIDQFYRELSHWSIVLVRPGYYGWKDGARELPPIVSHVHDIELTEKQLKDSQDASGSLFAGQSAGGIVSRSKLARISKSKEGLKPAFIRDLIATWPKESTIVWCKFNEEQEHIASMLPGCGNISGDTPFEKRQEIIADFKAGRRKVLVSKPKILGMGLNLQIATRMVFSSIHDSFEEYYQAVKRANRYGSTLPLNVHIPLTDLERPMVENVLRKANRVQEDTERQEEIFRKGWVE